MSKAGLLTEALRAALRDPAVEVLALDLDAVGFLDSSALGSLVVALNLAEQLDKSLHLVNVGPQSRLRELLELTGLLGAFDISEPAGPSCSAEV